MVDLYKLLSFATAAGRAYLAFRDRLQSAVRKAPQDHLQGERLAAYRPRHRWKASDVRLLLSIEVNEGAQRRMAGLKGRGDLWSGRIVRWRTCCAKG